MIRKLTLHLHLPQHQAILTLPSTDQMQSRLLLTALIGTLDTLAVNRNYLRPTRGDDVTDPVEKTPLECLCIKPLQHPSVGVGMRNAMA